MECAEMNNLCCIVDINSLSTRLDEIEEPSRKCVKNTLPLHSGSQYLQQRHSAILGGFILVPFPVHMDAEALRYCE